MDRLLKAASRIFRDPQAGIPFVTHRSMRMLICHVAIWPYKAKTDLSGYIHLCAEIGPSYNQFGYGCCLAGDYSTSNAFTALRL